MLIPIGTNKVLTFRNNQEVVKQRIIQNKCHFNKNSLQWKLQRKKESNSRFVETNFKFKTLNKLREQTQEICSRLQERWKESRICATSTYIINM